MKKLALKVKKSIVRVLLNILSIKGEKINHKSVTEYPEHLTAYLQEELDSRYILGPFRTQPIDHLNVSPFMTRDKSSSVNRQQIIDLVGLLDILLTLEWEVIVTWVLNLS